MNIITNDKIDLCEIVANKIVEIAARQGKELSSDDIFITIFEGDHCDIFDALLDDL